MFHALPAALLALVARQAFAAPPNVVLIMADDQDKHLDSMSYMPQVTNLIAAQGVTFESHYCTVAWCCPSRVNLLTGRAAHNTNVTTLTLPYGGWPKFVNQGLDDNWLPRWISAAGARTYYVGKLMNSYDETNWKEPYPGGWTNSTFCVDPWTYNYYNTAWTNGDANSGITSYNGTHATTVTEQKALEFVDDAATSGEQFFLMITPVAPHAQSGIKDQTGQNPPPAPPQYEGAFADAIAPRVPNFNPDVPSGVSWVYHRPKQSDRQVAMNDNFHRHRIRNIAGLDDLVASVIQRLGDHDLLDNTYIIYTSDNGFHIGNHRLDPGKRCGFEEDINIPLLIRGPNMPQNYTSQVTNAHTDIAPTILTMMGIPLRDDFDGEPIPTTEPDLSNSTKYEHVNVEFWDSPHSGADNSDGDYHADGTYYDNTYKSLRIKTSNESFYYSVWCTGEREFYDMTTDPFQMHNMLAAAVDVAAPATQDALFFGRPWRLLIDRLDALLMVLKSCQQASCTNPYAVLFPKGQVTGLQGAMDEAYDVYFAGSAKVSFTACHTGYRPEFEGVLEIKAYGAAAGPVRAGAGVLLVVVMGAWMAVWVLA